MLKHLEKIRNSSEYNKKKWVFLLSAISMVIIVLLWLVYMNIFIFSNAIKQEKDSFGSTFWPTLKIGISVTWEKTKDTANNISSFFFKIGKKEIEIKSPNN